MNYYPYPVYTVRADERLQKILQEQDLNLERILKASIRLAHKKFQEGNKQKGNASTVRDIPNAE